MNDINVSWDNVYDVDIDDQKGIRVWLKREKDDGADPSFVGEDDVGHNSKDGEAPEGGESEPVDLDNAEENVNDANEIYSEDGYHSMHNSDYSCSRGLILMTLAMGRI